MSRGFQQRGKNIKTLDTLQELNLLKTNLSRTFSLHYKEAHRSYFRLISKNDTFICQFCSLVKKNISLPKTDINLYRGNLPD